MWFTCISIWEKSFSNTNIVISHAKYMNFDYFNSDFKFDIKLYSEHIINSTKVFTVYK